MDCPICKKSYSESRRPKTLPCDHTFCLNCLLQIETQTDGRINCPRCMTKVPVDPRLIPDNLMVLRCLNRVPKSSLIQDVPSKRWWCLDCDAEVKPACRTQGHDTRSLAAHRRAQAKQLLEGLKRRVEALEAVRSLHAEALAALQRSSALWSQQLREAQDCLEALRDGRDPWEAQLTQAAQLLQASEILDEASLQKHQSKVEEKILQEEPALRVPLLLAVLKTLVKVENQQGKRGEAQPSEQEQQKTKGQELQGKEENQQERRDKKQNQKLHELQQEEHRGEITAEKKQIRGNTEQKQAASASPRESRHGVQQREPGKGKEDPVARKQELPKEGKHQPLEKPVKLPILEKVDVNEISRSGPGENSAEKQALLQRKVCALYNLHCDRDPGWVQTLLQRQAKYLVAIHLHRVSLDVLLMLPSMPQLQLVWLMSCQLAVKDNSTLAPDWKIPGLICLYVIDLPMRTVECLLSTHAQSLKWLTLLVGTEPPPGQQEKWPLTCSDLPKLLKSSVWLKKLKLVRPEHEHHDSLLCSNQLLLVRSVLPRCTVSCHKCDPRD